MTDTTVFRTTPDGVNVPGIPISVFETKRIRDVQAEFVSDWPRFVKQLRGSSSVVYLDKADAPLISPTHFCFGERLHAFAGNASVVFLDSDDHLTIDIAADVFERLNVSAVVYTSARNQPSNPRIRIVVPLERLISASVYRQVSRAMMRVIRKLLARDYGIDDWKFDSTKTHPGDLFFVPGTYVGGVTDGGMRFAPVNEFRSIEGGIWQPEEWVWLADQLAPIGQVISSPETTAETSISAGFVEHSGWSAEVRCADKLAAYRSMGCDRHSGLWSLALSLANSAYWWRHDLSAYDLADILTREQSNNPPTGRYSPRELYHAAQEAIDAAPPYVGAQKSLTSWASAVPQIDNWEYPRHPDPTLPWFERDLQAPGEELALSTPHDDAAVAVDFWTHYTPSNNDTDDHWQSWVALSAHLEGRSHDHQ